MEQNTTDINRVLWNSFRDIWFQEEGHKYVDSTGKQFTSVTKVIERYHSEFDSATISQFVAKKMSREQGRLVTPEEVIAMWKDINDYSKDIGTQIHLVIENLWQHKDYKHKFYKSYKYNNIQADFERRKVTCKNLVNRLSDRYVPLKNETIIYDKDSMLCGTIDFLAYDTRDNEIVIFDWKSNTKLRKKPEEYTDMMYAPFDNFYNLNFFHYCVQLSLYKAILEKNTGLKVGKMWLFHIHEDGNYYHHPVIDVSDIVKKQILVCK